LSWLLEEANPSVRYFTLRDLLGKSEDDSHVVAAKLAIPESPAVKRILQTQNPEGYWEKPTSPYLPNYKSSYWTIVLLGQLGASKTDARIGRACEHIFQFQLEEGGFAFQTRDTASREYEWRLKKGKKMPSRDEWISSLVSEQQLSCLTGNMVAALARLGYRNDPRVKRAAEWLVKVQHMDGGWLCPYWRAHIKDRHSCFHGAICSLEGLSEVEVGHSGREAIRRGAEFLLTHRLFKADHHGYGVINQSWLRLSFPWFAGYNLLRGLDVLTRLRYARDERLSDAVQVLLEKRQKDGTWVLEGAPSPMQASLEQKGKPSRWVTLIALRILKRFDSN
jgi:hypothetical protein